MQLLSSSPWENFPSLGQIPRCFLAASEVCSELAVAFSSHLGHVEDKLA